METRTCDSLCNDRTTDVCAVECEDEGDANEEGDVCGKGSEEYGALIWLA